MSNIQLLHASVDPDDTSELRILVDEKHVKYLFIEPGVYAAEDMCFGPSLVALLPPLPAGDWNEGHISRNPTSGQPFFRLAEKTQLPGITSIWHSVHIDHLELQIGTKLRSNVYEATSLRFTRPVVLKLACFSWQIPWLDDETRAYSWINGHGVGPEFLGHIEEAGRVIGFVMEHIPDAQHAELEHLPLCEEALLRLHSLGIKHGDVNKHNFLVSRGKATLIDFDMARRCDDCKDLDEEFRSLGMSLSDTSGRGGIVVETENDFAKENR